MSEPAALEYTGVSKKYGDTTALVDLNLRMEPGDFLGLVGPNGAGKTTAIHLATGLAKLQQGSIEVYGHDVVEDYQEARRKIGLAPQEPNFDRFFSVMDCLVYQGGYFGIPESEARERAEELLELFELSEKTDAKPPELSGGQKRRLLLAKALIHDPDLVILDEPTAGLDVELRHKLWDYLRKLKDRGKSILLTTHYIEEVEALATRVAMLNEGELVLSDDIETVMREYGRFQCIFDVDHMPEELSSTLQEQYPFIHVENSTLRANRRNFNQEIRDILYELMDHGIEIEGMRFEETELEEIFLDKVGQNGDEREELTTQSHG
jgi:ABC-2 type transport system ATP-binding protein